MKIPTDEECGFMAQAKFDIEMTHPDSMPMSEGSYSCFVCILAVPLFLNLIGDGRIYCVCEIFISSSYERHRLTLNPNPNLTFQAMKGID